ncbi:MAG: large subunit ribosomal protein, partial [Acetobacteraceae bacterium]|nr:large subunit ribosomal protein [Acetobacteraceae bacterium]
MSGTKNAPSKGKPGNAKTGTPKAGARGAGGPPAGKEAQRAARRVEIVGVDNPVTTGAEMPRFQRRYREEVRAKLRTEFGYANEMQVPKLEKIVINLGVGEATGDQKKLDAAVAELAAIAGQRPVKT